MPVKPPLGAPAPKAKVVSFGQTFEGKSLGEYLQLVMKVMQQAKNAGIERFIFSLPMA
jgi:hypothetical protein